MNIYEATKEMSYQQNMTESQMKRLLKDGYHIIVGDKNNYGNDMLKYDFFIDGDLLISGKVSDSTPDKIVITPESVSIFTDKYFSSIWNSYISSKDFFFTDETGIMHDADIRMGQWDLDTIRKQIKPEEIIYFNDVYAPMKNVNLPETSIYVIDNTDAKIVGIEAVRSAVASVTGTTITDDKKSADFLILILPNAIKAATGDIFQWLDKSNHNIPVIKNTLSTLKVNPDREKPILLYWSSNVLMLGLMNPDVARYKTASALNNAIKEFHKSYK